MKWAAALVLAALQQGCVVEAQRVDTNVDGGIKDTGVEVDATVAVDPNATTTTTTTSHDIDLVPDRLEAPTPYPAPAPLSDTYVLPPLPAPQAWAPHPGPGDGLFETCTYPTMCYDKSCDGYEDTTCAVLEESYGCDCSGCRCSLDRKQEEQPTPSPMADLEAEKSYACTADCVSDGASCDYWEFNTCEFLESSKGCDCSGCACTGGTCESDFEDDSTQPECNDWCGNTMTQWESCEHCECKACDFCVVGADGETAVEQQQGDRDNVAGTASRSMTLAASVVSVAIITAAYGAGVA